MQILAALVPAPDARISAPRKRKHDDGPNFAALYDEVFGTSFTQPRPGAAKHKNAKQSKKFKAGKSGKRSAGQQPTKRAKSDE